MCHFFVFFFSRSLFYSQCYSDVTFVTEDKGEISAHSSLLKIRVPKFYHLYVEATSPDGCHILPKIELPFVTSEQLEKLLR